MKLGLALLSTLLTAAAHADDLACESALGLMPRQSGLGPRGFLGSLGRVDEASVVALAARGIVPWSERIFVVGLEDEIYHQAFVHARMPDLRRASEEDFAGLPSGRLAKGPAWVTAALDRAFFLITQNKHPVRHHPLMTGLYVVVPGFKPAHANAGQQIARVADRLGDYDMFAVDDDSHLIPLPKDDVRRAFANARVVTRTDATEPLPHLEFEGFFHPRHRVVLDLKTWSPAPSTVGADLAFDVTAYSDCIVIETLRKVPLADDHARIATVIGSNVNGRLTLATTDAQTLPPRREGEARVKRPVGERVPLAQVRDRLIELGVREVDLTNVEELHHLADGRVEPVILD